MAQLTEATACFCVELIGNYLYVSAKRGGDFVIYCYHIVSNTWETLPPFFASANQIDCLCCLEDHIYAIYNTVALCRYSVTTKQWQHVSKSSAVCNLSKAYCRKAAVVFRSCIYVLYGQRVRYITHDFKPYWQNKVAVLHRFDPKRNVWEQRASTTESHFEFSLFVVNKRLCVAGGKCTTNEYNNKPGGKTASVEVYDEQNNNWSVVQQTHIPPNNLGAVEVDRRVYFIINSFPVDSGIRIPPGEVYPVCLDEWANLGTIQANSTLCYVPIKMDNLTVECT